jgi:hypothetical protein
VAEASLITSPIPVGNRKRTMILLFVGVCLISLLLSLIVRMATEFTELRPESPVSSERG